MMRLIDADALQRFVIELTTEKGISTIHAVFETTIQNAPTIEAEPVRHGRWIDPFENRSACGIVLQCTECNNAVLSNTSKNWNYCPRCGCRMDGGAEDD